MSRRHDAPAAKRSGPAAPASEIDEACFLAELRLSVEGARTAAEERLERRLPDWSARLARLSARFAH